MFDNTENFQELTDEQLTEVTGGAGLLSSTLGDVTGIIPNVAVGTQANVGVLGLANADVAVGVDVSRPQ